MTITEFLLARIAEDERDAGSLKSSWEKYPPSAYDVAQVGYLDAGDPGRVLAECEAKRRIVMECSEMQMSGIELAAYLATRTIWNLAQPFADHPDFREEWGLSQ